MVPIRLTSRFRRNPKPPETFDGVLVLRHGRPYDPAWDLWRPIRRWPGVIISALVTTGLLLSIAYHFQHRVTQAKAVVQAPVGQPIQPAYFPPVSLTSGAVQHFTGVTSGFNIPFTATGRLTSWTFSCRCTNNFNVVVHSAAGALIEIPVNTIGPTRVATVANYKAGDYTFDVTADGRWTANLIDESQLAQIPTPYRYFSAGTSVLGPFSSTSNHLSVGYLGSLGELLSVHVVDKNGAGYGYPIFTIRQISANLTLTNLPPRSYYLVVSGVGLWLVDVK